MSRASMCTSSGEKIAVSMQHWNLSLWMDGVWSAGWTENPTNANKPLLLPDPVAVRSKAHIRGRLCTTIAGSNLTEGMGIRLVCLLCVVLAAASEMSWSLVQRSPTVCVCVCVCVCLTVDKLEPPTMGRPTSELGCKDKEHESLFLYNFTV